MSAYDDAVQAWTEECEEWNAISAEMIAQAEKSVSLFDVSEALRRSGRPCNEREWNAAKNEILLGKGPSAFDVPEEQRRRRVARGEPAMADLRALGIERDAA